MTLVLEIEYLTGVSFAAVGPDSEEPDWPPQPDRIFSALVAAWAARGQDSREAEALEWLERLRPPHILASTGASRASPLVFVPPNDPRSDKKKGAKGVLPLLRSRQPRRFPAIRPLDAVVRLFWVGAEPEEETLAGLQRLACDAAYVGHSAALTRCRFLFGNKASTFTEAKPPERCVYSGRFAELRQRFDAGLRPLPGARVAPAPDEKQGRTNLFGDRWLILEHVGGEMPDVRACVLIAKTIRDTLLYGYQQSGLGDNIPEIVSGHAADRSPTRAPHLAIVPLPFSGFPHADGHVMGFAIVPPRDSAILDDENFRRVLRRLAPIDEERGRRVLTLKPKAATSSHQAFCIDLSPTFEPPAGKRSLDPALYVRPSRTFATVTPIALDRHLREQGAARSAEAATLIANGCRNIGLPAPEAITCDKHSAIEGVPAAYPSNKSPAWMRWRLPGSLASRQLTHAVICFEAPVEGPVILGAGRFVGLGLCRPLSRRGDDAVRG